MPTTQESMVFSAWINVMRILLFLWLLFGWGSVNAGDVLLKCVNKDGLVTFTKTIRKGESCAPLLQKNSQAFEVPPVEERKAEVLRPPTNFVLMCQESEYTDFRLLDAPSNQWTKQQFETFRHLREYQKERNERPKRPYFALKYLENKLSYNWQGNVWLNNDVPGQPNDLGWVGTIYTREDSILLEIKNTDMGHMRTLLQVDRYTGLYKALKFSPGKEAADEMETGKCEKYNEKLF